MRGVLGRALAARGRSLLVAAAAGLFLAVLAPFGTGAAPFVVRLAYWLIVLTGGTLIGLAAMAAVTDRLPQPARRPAVETGLVAALVTLFGAPAVFAVTNLMFGGVWTWGALLGFAWPVFVISLAVTALNTLVHRSPAETHAGPAGSPPPRFLERLPPRLRGGDLYAVEAEDHYLRLHTSRGQDLILLRLADAMAELEGVEGAQTHRSWWVARDGFAAAARSDGRAVLTLKDGAEAPVSRTYAKALREAGWF